MVCSVGVLFEEAPPPPFYPLKGDQTVRVFTPASQCFEDSVVTEYQGSFLGVLYRKSIA